jgi:hypothetical protein
LTTPASRLARSVREGERILPVQLSKTEACLEAQPAAIRAHLPDSVIPISMPGG